MWYNIKDKMNSSKQISREECSKLFHENCHYIGNGVWEINEEFKGTLLCREPLDGDFDYHEDENIYPVETTFVLVEDKNDSIQKES